MPQEQSKTRVALALARPGLKLQSDDRLVELARAGHGEAFEAIVERYRRPLISHCRRMVGTDLAQDVVQQTFTSAHDKLCNDSRELHLRAWLYRVATNLALNTLRQKDSGHELLREDSGYAEQPGETVERAEEMQTLVESLRRLPERERHALLLKEAEGKSFDDIALILGGTPQGVKQLAYRARRRLRDTCGMLLPIPLLLWLLRGGKGLGASKGAALVGARSIAWLKIATAVVVVTGVVFGANAMRHASAPKQALASPSNSQPSTPPAEAAAAAGPATVVAPVAGKPVTPSAAPVQPGNTPVATPDQPVAAPTQPAVQHHGTNHDGKQAPKTTEPKTTEPKTTEPKTTEPKTTDTSAPDTTLSGPSGVTSDNTPTFDFNSSESGSSFECRLDSAAWASCGSPDTLAALPDGPHNFEVRAIDAAGNTDPTPANGIFTVSTGLGPTWQSPALVSDPGENAYSPDVALDDSGDGFAVWQRFDGANFRVQVAYRSAGGSFGSAQTLSTPGYPAMAPKIAVNGQGDAVALWQQWNSGSNGVTYAAYRPAGGAFGAAQMLSDPAHSASGARVAIDEQGNVFAAWTADDGVNYRAYVAYRPAGGSFGAAQAVSAPGNHAQNPVVAVDDQGDALVAWQRSDGSNERTQAAYRPAGGSFGAPETLSAAGADAPNPEVQMNADGNAIVVWGRGDYTNRLVQTAYRPAGGSFGTVETISDPGENVYNWHAAIDGRGNSVAVWERLVSSHESVQTAYRPAGAAFGAADTISEAGTEATDPQVAIDDQGNAVAVWSRAVSPTDLTVQSAFRPAGGSFDSPQIISGAGLVIMNPQVAINDRGDTLAAWRGYDGTRPRIELATGN
jgi:RNA polymerase sigma factor (sigma-70 family)